MQIKLPRIDSEQISAKIKKTLLQLLKNNTFGETKKLPAEDVLAEQLGVSRTVLRDALGALEAEGYITRRRSIGTTINSYILEAEARIDLQKEFQEMISDAGYQEGFELLHMTMEPAQNKQFRDYRILENEKVLRVDKLFTADGNPAVYCVDYVLERFMPAGDVDKELFKKISIFSYLKEYCGQEVFMSLSEVEATAASKRQSTILEVKEDAPILMLHERGFDVNQKQVLSSEITFKNGIFNLAVLRKKI